MSTKTISSGYPSGYIISGTYDTISITSGGSIGGSGIRSGYVHNQPYTILNSGSIHGGAFPVYLQYGGVVHNYAGASITGGSGLIVKIGRNPGVSPGTVINDGVMTAAGSGGIRFTAGGQITNTSSGTISTPGDAVYVDASGAATVVNAGTIVSSHYNGVRLGAAAGSKLINSGKITSTTPYSSNGAVFLATGTSMTNTSTGTITGTGTAAQSGVVINWSNVTVVNQGIVTGGTAGILSLNGGYISNATSAYIGGTVDGVRATSSGALTINNSGTVKGGTHAAYFHQYYCTLTAQAGSKLIGPVAAGSTSFKATMVLGSAGGAGVLSGLGTGTITSANIGTFAISHFNTYTVAAAATWTVGGTNTVNAGQTLTVSGELGLSGTISMQGKLAGTGTIRLASAGTLDVGVSVAAPPTVDFYNTSSLLKLDQSAPATYTGVSIVNFGVGGVLDLTDLGYSSGDRVSYSAGKVTLSNAGGTILTKVTLTTAAGLGVLSALPDGAGGTKIVGYGFPANVAPPQCMVVS